MGEKQNKKNNNDGEKKKADGGEKKGDNTQITVVLKVDMHCEGCATKTIRCVKNFDGVETVKAEWDSNKLTIVGMVDPLKVQEKLSQKTKKKVDLISPQPKKDGKGGGSESQKKNDEKKTEEKKPKEAPVTTAVLKVELHCQGCIEKIHKLISKTKGVHEMSVDRQKDLVTVKGTMDAKGVAKSLNEKLKRNVEIVPPKKEKDSGDKKEAGGGGGGGDGDGKKGKGGGEGKKGKGGGGGEEGKQVETGGGGGGKMEGNKMEYMGVPQYGYGYGYGHGYMEQVHAPQLFSDENPNACSVM